MSTNDNAMSAAALIQQGRSTKSASRWRILLRYPLMSVGFAVFLTLILTIIAGPYLVSNDPLQIEMSDRLQPPSWDNPLGTDHLGRCMFSRLVAGAQITLSLAGIVIAATILIGVPIGLLTGYVGGRLDTFIMRIVDGIGALPEIIIAIAVSGFLGPSISNLLLAVIAVKWIEYVRLVRSIVLLEREKEYMEAARAAGFGTWHMIRRQLLPHIVSPVVVLASLDIGKIILIVASLSYLGLGAQPPTPEWGAMLNDGRPYFQTIPELMIYPGLCIMLVVMSCNLIGDGLRQLLDVRNK
ncbi:ABC transporter permease subunit [Paenibacillus sp. SC116]|uniref:nickel transporter permease n=1 Tax=Paenibacillus sp. SC116 TaxID=2968986 RepID=UPI00215AFB03|nr:nickel transporter permease [Paenibacillus sp. SC116]MCR8842702.1 ABC transporter permease subunit [Paenibacillus sp. SC116]